MLLASWQACALPNMGSRRLRAAQIGSYNRDLGHKQAKIISMDLSEAFDMVRNGISHSIGLQQSLANKQGAVKTKHRLRKSSACGSVCKNCLLIS